MAAGSVCVVISIVLYSTVAAQIHTWGSDPQYLSVGDFDIERFLGKWYEIKRYLSSSGTNRCILKKIVETSNELPEVVNEVPSESYGSLSGIKHGANLFLFGTGVKRCFARRPQGNVENADEKLNVVYASKAHRKSTLTVLDTDYETYAVIMGCSGFPLINAYNIWIVTRERFPSPTVMDSAYNALIKHRIGRIFLVEVDIGCTFLATESNGYSTITTPLPELEGTLEKSINDIEQ